MLPAKGGMACSLLRHAKKHSRLMWLSMAIAAVLLMATLRCAGSGGSGYRTGT